MSIAESRPTEENCHRIHLAIRRFNQRIIDLTTAAAQGRDGHYNPNFPLKTGLHGTNVAVLREFENKYEEFLRSVQHTLKAHGIDYNENRQLDDRMRIESGSLFDPVIPASASRRLCEKYLHLMHALIPTIPKEQTIPLGGQPLETLRDLVDVMATISKELKMELKLDMPPGIGPYRSLPPYLKKAVDDIITNAQGPSRGGGGGKAA